MTDTKSEECIPCVEPAKGPRHSQLTLMGTIVDIDVRETGAAMIFIEAGEREETAMEKSLVLTYFTPVFPVRVPARVMERTDPALLVKGQNIKADGSLQGIKRFPEGDDKPFYQLEVQVTRIRKAV